MRRKIRAVTRSRSASLGGGGALADEIANYAELHRAVTRLADMLND